MSLQRLLLLVLLGLCAWPVYAESEASTPARAWPQAAAPIPYKQDQEEGLMGRAIGGFALALLLAWGGAHALKRYAPWLTGRSVTATRRLHHVETLRLTTKSTLFIVELEGESLLLAEGSHGVQLIRTLPKPTEEPAAEQDHA